MANRTALRWGLAALAALAAASPAARGDDTQDPIRIAHRVQVEGDAFLVTAEGTANLPDGAVLQLRLLPVVEAGAAGDPIRTARVEVREGRFAIPPWTVPRAEVRAFEYRIEAGPAGEQPPAAERRMSRIAKRWKASVRLVLGDWRALCSRLPAVARALRERVAAVSRHRDELRALALEACAGRLARAAWTAWRARSGFARARENCLQFLDAPAAAATFPLARERAYAMLSEFDYVLGGVDTLVAGGPAAEGDSGQEFRADFKISPLAVADDYLQTVEAPLAAEGTRHLAVALEEIVKPLDPAAASAAKADAPAAAEKGLKEVLDRSKAFFDVVSSNNVQELQGAVLKAIETAQRLAEETRKASAPAAEAGAAAARNATWQDLRAGLGGLRDSLRRQLGS